MLEGYHDHDGYDDEVKHKRLLAVRAALEIAKESVSPSIVRPQSSLSDVEAHIGSLADAIQNALK
ncbi:hypothetical protein REJ26_000750 [Providencia stuartii]|uniref:hypothetical protein n=1 Tax=Providencia TaxID=586 RepID=UPI00234AD23B|nr:MULTISPECIES: hypothetical protein [unclassified Providencia]ELR5299020.1 hypothetical protein [Providencia stuartii]EMC8778317.1 hypothetical protein [Providencia rettgeri]MDW7587525.1 hypothetical protein [Providencia sp. 2023EL-00965]